MIEMFASFLAHNVVARGYPSRPVTIVVPFAPGSQDDLEVRRLARHVGLAAAQHLTVENRHGESGDEARRRVDRACPDGYTVLLVRDDAQASCYRVGGPWCLPWNAVACLQRLFDDAGRDSA